MLSSDMMEAGSIGILRSQSTGKTIRVWWASRCRKTLMVWNLDVVPTVRTNTALSSFTRVIVLDQVTELNCICRMVSMMETRLDRTMSSNET